MSAAHTPGKWTHDFEERDGNVEAIHVRAVGRYIASVEPHGDHIDGDGTATEGMANARLIAAAPALLAALKSFEEECTHPDHVLQKLVANPAMSLGTFGAKKAAKVLAARAALAKAEGRA